MTLIRRLLTAFRLLEQQQALIMAQQALILDHQHELRRVHLEHVREMEGIVCGWLIHCDQPEIDIRHDLCQLSTTLAHRAAALEEHVL
jgi:hypothetical protein